MQPHADLAKLLSRNLGFSESHLESRRTGLSDAGFDRFRGSGKEIVAPIDSGVDLRLIQLGQITRTVRYLWWIIYL